MIAGPAGAHLYSVLSRFVGVFTEGQLLVNAEIKSSLAPWFYSALHVKVS